MARVDGGARGGDGVCDALLCALGDRYARMILLAVMSRPMSPLEIARRLGIPQATVYRKLRMLERMGLVAREGFTLSPGTMRWSGRYRALVKEAVIRVSPEGVAVELRGEAKGRGSGIPVGSYQN